MKFLRALVSVFFLSSLGLVSAATAAESAWPEITRENKPWTRWWWPGSAVDQPNLTHQLEQFAAAGLGGVEITPIYGAKGAEERYLDFLSPRWLEMLEHTGREAKRLGLGVDMATGTGWPFGGPWVNPADGSAKLVLKDEQLAGEPTHMQVKRAAPGDEGRVVDPYSPGALERYLAPFGAAFASFPRGLIRGQFHDSFEYYGAEWTPNLPAVFQQLHGYDVQTFAAQLRGGKPGDADTLARVRADFRATLAHLHLAYLETWVNWSHERGFIVRNQSHGAPANLLDLYGAVDVAETETFGSTPFPIPGLRRLDDEVRHGQDLPEPLVMRMASSAAHVSGHPLVSSETCTWLREHWKDALAYAKPEIDRLFVNGINHVFFHGTVYSPADAAWPGWLFYASTQFNPRNSWWDDFGALNHYVARVQSILQRGQPDNEVLLYWPFADVQESSKGPLLQQLGVHEVKWLTASPAGLLAQQLIDRGYSFDYISDAQLAKTRADGRGLLTQGGHYKVILVPATRRMPVATLQQLAKLARAGATVLFEKLPEDVPGFGQLAARRADFQAALTQLDKIKVLPGDLLASLPTHGVARETIADTGVSFIRRREKDGYSYFFTNLTARPLDDWVQLGKPARAATLLDPLSGVAGRAVLKAVNAQTTRIYLQLAPGESLLLRTSDLAAAPTPADARETWAYRAAAGQPIDLTGTWKVEFLKGGPVLPAAFETNELKSWTELGDAEAQRFAGTARYRLEFDLPSVNSGSPADWQLDLGDVRETARVRLNGHLVATAWSVPFHLRVGQHLKPGRNVLELDVTNLAANRIRDLDQRQVDWKIMREINFVDINYKPFDASGWPLTPSGLLGPVTLTPFRTLQP